MTAGRSFRVAPIEPEHVQGVVKLYRAVAGFEGSVPEQGADLVEALLSHPSSQGGRAWRVALAQNGAVVGVLSVRFVGTKRTEISLAVNPAWRRRGIGKALLESVPEGKRLLVTSHANVEAATAFLEKAGFQERWRDVRMRRRGARSEPPKLPGWAELEEDWAKDPARYARAAREAFGDDDAPDEAMARALLSRPGARVLYLKTPQGDQGVSLVLGLPWAKKAERSAEGEPAVGLLERIGLAKPCRGKGLSRPFVRASLLLLEESGYEEIEVVADGRKEQAIDLYRREGFESIGEVIRWIRRDEES